MSDHLGVHRSQVPVPDDSSALSRNFQTENDNFQSVLVDCLDPGDWRRALQSEDFVMSWGLMNEKCVFFILLDTHKLSAFRLWNHPEDLEVQNLNFGNELGISKFDFEVCKKFLLRTAPHQTSQAVPSAKRLIQKFECSTRFKREKNRQFGNRHSQS